MVNKYVIKVVNKEMRRFMRDVREESKGHLVVKYDKEQLMDKYNLDKKDYKKMRKLFREELELLKTKVTKFTNDVWALYGGGELNFIQIIQQAKEFLASHPEYDLDEREFHLFTQNLEHKLDEDNKLLVYGGRSQTTLSKRLGEIVHPSLGPSKLKMDDSDKKTFREIMAIAEATAPTHGASLFQNIDYGDGSRTGNMNQLVMNATYLQKDNILSFHTHPLLVAMFAPQIPMIEDRFLNTFLAGIVRARFLNRSISSRQDYEFYYDMTHDRNDNVCSCEDNVFIDLLRRIRVQEKMRKAVYNMRNGYFFTGDSSLFLKEIDGCRKSKYDAPHLVFNHDEGTILRRLLSIFCYRPTRVTTSPVFLQNNQSRVPETIHPLSMIHIHIPWWNGPKHMFAKSGPSVSGYLYNIGPLTINRWSCSEIWKLTPNMVKEKNMTWFVQNGVAMPRNTNILYTRNILIFYVNRRHYRTIPDKTRYLFSRLPLTVVGLEIMNDYPVEVPDLLDTNQAFLANRDPNNRYWLRSVVCARPADPIEFTEDGLLNRVINVNGCTSIIINRVKNVVNGVEQPLKRDNVDGVMEYDPWKLKGDKAKVFTNYRLLGMPGGGLAGTGTTGFVAGDTRFDALFVRGCCGDKAIIPSRDVEVVRENTFNGMTRAFGGISCVTKKPVSSECTAVPHLYTIGFKMRHFGTIFIYSREITELKSKRY